MELASKAMESTKKLIDGILQTMFCSCICCCSSFSVSMFIEGYCMLFRHSIFYSSIKSISYSNMTCCAIASNDSKIVNILAVADVMEEQYGRQQIVSIFLSCHIINTIDWLIEDLSMSVE